MTLVALKKFFLV